MIAVLYRGGKHIHQIIVLLFGLLELNQTSFLILKAAVDTLAPQDFCLWNASFLEC